MASKQDTMSRVCGCSQEEITHNHETAKAQASKTAFRTHNLALSADKFNPARLKNAVQQKLRD